MNLHEAIPDEKFDEKYIDEVIEYFRESGMNPRIRKYATLFFMKELGIKPTVKKIRRATGGVKI